MQKRRLLQCCLLACLFGCVSAVEAEEAVSASLPRSLSRVTLPNGLRVWHLLRTESPSVAVGVVIRAGTRSEEVSNSGISHFVEHMCFSGSEHLDEGQLVETIASRGGIWQGQTEDERTMYWALIAAEHFEVTSEWISQLVFHPTFPEEKVATVRSTIMQEKGGKEPWIEHVLDRLGYDNDLDKKMREALFPDSPLGRLAIGKDKSLSAIDREAVVTYHAAHYVPGNAVLVVVGNVDRARVDAVCAKYFADLPQGTPPPAYVEPALPAKAARPYNGRTAGTRGQATLQVGVRTVGERHPDHWPLRVLAKLLDQSLFKEMQLNKGLSYERHVMQASLSDTGYFLASVAAKSTDLKRVDGIVQSQIDRIRQGDIDPEKVEQAKSALKGIWALSQEGNLSRIFYLESKVFTCSDAEALPDVPVMLDAVTPADLKRVVETYFTPQRTHKATLRPALGCL